MNLTATVFRRCEIVLHSRKAYDNPFMDVDIDAVFTHVDGTRIAIPGFWNGENEWKVRFIAEKPGVWRYDVACTDKDNPSLTDSGLIDVSDAPPRTEIEKHGYVVIPEGSHFLAHKDGTPFFYLGDTHWQMPDYERLHECNYPGCSCGNQFKHLADDRIKKGFTVCQTYFDSAESDGGGNKRVHHWWAEKYTRINPQAFNETMDEMIEYLTENGIVTAMGFGVHLGSVNAYRGDIRAMLAFARYCVARYACYPVMWLTAQEITNPGPYDAFTLWKRVGELVGKLDGYHHPNGAHMNPMYADSRFSRDLNKQPWYKIWFLQGGHGAFDELRSRRFYEGYWKTGKPFLESEFHYEDLYRDNNKICDDIRIGAWFAVQCGAAGFTYGVTGVWAMRWSTERIGWCGYSPEPWYIGMDKPGSTEMTYLKRFYDYVGFPLEPAGLSLGGFEEGKYVSISHRGQDVIVYQFFSPHEPIEGKLLHLKANVRYQARWYDPVNGTFIDLPDLITSDGTAPVPARPSVRDWILLLNTIDLGPYEAVAYPAAHDPIPASAATPGEQYPIASIRTSSEDPAHPASDMIDGKADTFWQGFTSRTSQTIVADLGEEKELGYLKLVCPLPEYRFIHYRIYGSQDGESWRMLLERPTDQVAIGGQYGTFYEPLRGSWRYVKFVLLTTFAMPQLPLTEFALLAENKK